MRSILSKMRSIITKKNKDGQFQDGSNNTQAGRDIIESSKAMDYYYDNIDLQDYYELCEEGKKDSPRAKALRTTLKKRGYNLDDPN